MFHVKLTLTYDGEMACKECLEDGLATAILIAPPDSWDFNLMTVDGAINKHKRTYHREDDTPKGFRYA
jgi:hypothetical protein